MFLFKNMLRNHILNKIKKQQIVFLSSIRLNFGIENSHNYYTGHMHPTAFKNCHSVWHHCYGILTLTALDRDFNELIVFSFNIEIGPTKVRKSRYNRKVPTRELSRVNW